MAVDERWRGLGEAMDLVNLEVIQFREYQYNIIKSVFAHGNTLIVLPTGLGKTFIGISIIANAVSKGKKALFLAPTKPLAEQHAKTLQQVLKLNNDQILLLTGGVAKKDRKELESKASVIVATPQTISNDLKNALISLDEFGAVIFDECHRAVGKYAYTYIANECNVRGILIVGLTASPGSKLQKIKALVETLNIRHIEARISTDSDVVKYVMPKYVHIVNVEMSDRIKQISGLLKPPIESSLASLNKSGLTNFRYFDNIPKGRLIALGDTIGRIQASGFRYAAMFSYVKLLNLSHAYDLLTIEGIYPFSRYMQGLQEREKKSRSVESLLKDTNVIAAMNIAREAVKNGEEHSKVYAVLDIIKDYKDKSAIIFVQYRSTIKMLVEFLNNNGFASMPFVGKKEGVTQEKQKQIIEDFRNRKFNVLVASSIGEEGLDIPSVDLVLFYEPIPNEIRNIQRRGRTGRFREGDVYILVAIGTKDQVYLYISKKREEKMLIYIKEINQRLVLKENESDGQKTL